MNETGLCTTYIDYEKILPIMFYTLSNDLSALKECRILHIENLTSDKKSSGIKLLMNIVLIIEILPKFLKYEIKIMESVM